jgi:IS30 family transposase
MPRTYRQLDLVERRAIFRLLNAKIPVAAIAQEVGRHRSTIHREIRRNRFHGPREYAGYYPLNAQDLASERRKRQRKLCRDFSLRDYIIAGLERCWSPEQIAGRLRQEAGGSTEPRRVCRRLVGLSPTRPSACSPERCRRRLRPRPGGRSRWVQAGAGD